MENSAFAIFGFISAILPECWGFPVDLSSVGTGPLHSVWLASSPVFAVIFLFILIVILFGCVCCRPGKGFQEFRNSNGALAVSTEFVNPRAGAELTIFPPIGATVPELAANSGVVRTDHTLVDVRHANLRPASFSSSERPLSSQDWFYEPHLNFPRGQLQYVQDYGRGWFGRVVAGEAVLISPPEPRSKVIVKILHEDATPTDQMFFLHEVKPHRDLKHPNILRLLGRCLETEPFLLLLESCPNGDLKTFLTQNMASAHALTSQGVVLRMARDVTAGVEFMHANKFVHTDLAARNCLVSSDLSIKIGDYGNSIEVFPQDYYIAGSVALPVRWCAPETLRCTDVTIETKEVTTFANVWALAVVIWEMCEFGRLPYEELTDDQVIVRVLGEKTYFLPSPTKYCLYKDELYHLMKLCWNPPLQRPTVAQIKVILDNLVSCDKSSADTGDSTLEFEQRWQVSKPNTIPKTDNTDVIQPVTIVKKDIPKAQQPRGARVGDSHGDAPIGAFMEDSKPLGSDSPRFMLKKSDSVQNVSGSLERLNALSKKVEEAYQMGEAELDSWLQGVEVKNEEDEKFVRNISEAIRDLDMALALEKTSSSEETSGRSSNQNSPGKEHRVRKPVEAEDSEKASGFVVDFKLGGDTSSFMISPKSFELSSLQNTMEPQSLTFTSLIFPDVKPDPVFIPSLSDAEEEMWKTRIERGEFSEKVKEKSRSIADLMVLTHIDPSDDSDEGDKDRNSLLWKTNPRTSLTSNIFGSENDIRHAVLEEGFEESLKRLSHEHKEHGKFDSLNMIVPDEARRVNLLKTLQSNQEPDIFLGNVASENCDNSGENECACVLQTATSSQGEKGSDLPVIYVQEVEDEPPIEEKEDLVLEYTRKPLRFVMKEDNSEPIAEKENEESSVTLGPFEDDMLQHYQGVRTTFGNVDIIEKWNNHLDSALQAQLNETNFDTITFQSLEMKPSGETETEPIINNITNLGDNVWSEEENDGKLRTPDDERSSDSGFRDKGSLSESVEDACEGKYNLEDIEAELEEAFVKGAFNTREETDKKNDINFEFEESKFYEDENKNDDDLSDIEGEMEMWQPHDTEYYPDISDLSPQGAKGWYLHPPEDKGSVNDGEVDDDFVQALRKELVNKLPIQSRSFEQEEEELDDLSKPTINIEYNTSTSLTPIFEEYDEPVVRSPNGTVKNRRKNVVGLMESVKNIDTETFMQYLDYMVENEGKEDESVVEEMCGMEAEEDTNTPMIIITKHSTETGGSSLFEEDIKTALGYDAKFSPETEQPKSIVLFEDLEEGSMCEVVDETRTADDVIVVDTSTNEATLMESAKPKSHIAFVDRMEGDYTPDSISPDREVSLSEDSSRGEASTDINSSPDLLSDFFITPDKTPFQSPRTIPKITTVEELKENNEATEIVGALLELKTSPQPQAPLTETDGSLPKIKHSVAMSATEQFLKQERLHTVDLLLESSRKLERFEMSTSFMGDEAGDAEEVSEDGKEGDAVTYTPDWETGSSDEDGSSSSGEFIWKDGGQEAPVKVKQASFDLDTPVNGGDAADGGAETEEDDASSSDSASVTDFVPSAWDSQATPKKSALRKTDNASDKRRVWFKKEKYHCIYEYPREPSDMEDTDAVDTVDYSQFADWDLQDGDAGPDGDIDGEDSITDSDPRPAKKTTEFYTLGPFDDVSSNSALNEDGEFFVSSSTRPFQSKGVGAFFTGSQFSAFAAGPLWAASPTTDNLLDETDYVTPDSGVEDLSSATPGEASLTNENPVKLEKATNPLVPTTPNDTSAVDPPNHSESLSPLDKLGLGMRRPARESLTLDLPKNHNSDLGLVLNGVKKGPGVESL